MPNPHPRTSLLLERWHRGEQEALSLLLTSHSDWLHRQVRRCMPPALRARADSMDMVQDCLLEFLANAPRFTIDNGKLFRGLMLKIAQNTMREQYRWWSAARRDLARERPLPTETVLDLETNGASPPEQAIAAEREAWVRFGLEFLDTAEQRVILMRDHEQLSFVEIAARLGIKSDAARMRHSRSVDRLTEVVGQLRRGELAQLVPQDGSGDRGAEFLIDHDRGDVCGDARNGEQG